MIKIVSHALSFLESFFQVRADVILDPDALDLPTSFTDLGSVVSAALPLVVSVTGLGMFGYLIFGGIRYIMAAGDTKQIQDAVRTITNAVIGLAIVFASFWAVRIVETVFGLKITGY